MKGGEQHLYMNSGCFADGLLMPVHELLHTLGFVHEHTRPDRDRFVVVNEAHGGLKMFLVLFGLLPCKAKMKFLA